MHPLGAVTACRVSGDGVRGSVLHTRDMDHGESVTKCFLLEVPESIVWDFIELSVTKELQQWRVVNGDGKILASQDEVAGLFQCIGHG